MISKTRDCFEFPGLDQAADLQMELSALVNAEDEPGFNPTKICGVDAAYADDKGVSVAAVWDLPTHQIVEMTRVHDKISVDYLPGFFGFREGRLILGAATRLDSNPDAFLVDGHGMAHPRRFGLACHVGLALNKPTVGVAKSHFYGIREGESVVDSDGTLLGKILTGKEERSCYVSVGHKVSLNKAVEIVESCSENGYPIPLRIAHSEAVRMKESL